MFSFRQQLATHCLGAGAGTMKSMFLTHIRLHGACQRFRWVRQHDEGLVLISLHYLSLSIYFQTMKIQNDDLRLFIWWPHGGFICRVPLRPPETAMPVPSWGTKVTSPAVWWVEKLIYTNYKYYIAKSMWTRLHLWSKTVCFSWF